MATSQNLNNEMENEETKKTKKTSRTSKSSADKADSTPKTVAAKKTSVKTKTTAAKKTVEKAETGDLKKTAAKAKTTAAKKTVSKSETEPAAKTEKSVTAKATAAKTATTARSAAAKKTSSQKKSSDESEKSVSRTTARKSTVSKDDESKKTPVKKSASETGRSKTTAKVKSPASSESIEKSAAGKKVSSTKAKTEFSPTGVMVKKTPAAAASPKENESINVIKENPVQSMDEVRNSTADSEEVKGITSVQGENLVLTEEMKSLSDTSKPQTDSIDEERNDDLRQLEKMMQSSGLRKKSDEKFTSYKEKKKGKKAIVAVLIALALLGGGILGSVKSCSGFGAGVEKNMSVEDLIAYAEKLIAKGDYVRAAELLSGIDINSSDEKSMELRGKINSLLKKTFDKALDEGKENELFDLAEKLIARGKISDALKILANAVVEGDDEKSVALRNRISGYEKNAVDKAAAEGRLQEVIDTAKKLIADGIYVPAVEILSMIDVKGNDAESRLLRNQIYALTDQGINKAIENGQAEEIFKLAEKLLENGDSIKALEILSYAEIKGDDPESIKLKDKLKELKDRSVAKALSEGKKDDVLAKAKQMISDGDYENALKFLSSINPDGDDPESRAIRNELRRLKKETVERALAEGRIDDVLSTADKLTENGQYANAVELLNMINISGNSEEANALREKIKAKKDAAVEKALSEGKSDELVKAARQMIDDGDYSGALGLLGAVKINGNDAESKKLRNEIESIKRKAVEEAVREGRGDEIFDLVEKMIREENYDEAENILGYIDNLGNDLNTSELKEKSKRLLAQSEILKNTSSLSDDEKIAMAEKLMKEGRYDEALTLLNSIEVKGDDEKSKLLKSKIDEAKKKTVEEASKHGIDLGSLGYDENGNPVLSREEKARRQQQEKIAREMAEKKAEEEKITAEIEKRLEEKLNREKEIQKAAEEKKAKQEAAKKAAAEKKEREEAEKKLAAEKKALEETAKKIAAEKTALEESIKKAEAERLKKEGDEKRAEEERIARQEAEKKLEAERLARLEEEKKNSADRVKAEIDSAISKGKMLLEQGDIEGALKEFERAESLLPENDDSYSGQKLGEIAKMLYDASENSSGENKKRLASEAGQKAKKAMVKNPADPNALFVASMDEMNRRNLSEAERLLKEAIKRNPANFMYYYQLGRVLAMQKKYSESLNAFQSCIKLNDRFAPAYYNSGYVSEQLDKKNDALEYYKKATEINPAHENAFIGQGHVLKEMNKTALAAEAFKKALALNSKRSQIYEELGSCSIDQKNYAEAENYLKKALDCPDSKGEKKALTYYNLSTVMYEQKKNNDALNYAKLAYTNMGNSESSIKANIIYNYGLLTQTLGSIDTAIDLYKQALAVEPEHVKANTNLGVALLKKDNAPDAVVALSNAYKVEPENFEVNNNLGSAYRQIANYQKSAFHYKKALSLKPDDLTVKQNLARSYASAKDYSNAKKMYEELIQKEPSKYDHMLEYARVCVFSGDTTNAEKYLLYLQTKAPDFHKDEVSAMLNELSQ